MIFASENNDINLGFEILLRLIDEALDKHTPVKKCKKNPEKTKTCYKTSQYERQTIQEMIKSKND